MKQRAVFTPAALSRIFRWLAAGAAIGAVSFAAAQSTYAPLPTFEANLARPEISCLVTAGHLFLGVAFTVTLVVQVVRITLGSAAPSTILQTLFLYATLFGLYTYGGRVMSEVSSLIVSATAGPAVTVAETYASFDEATMRLAFGPQPASSEEEGTGNAALPTLMTPPVLWGLFFAVVFKGLLVLAVAVKFLLLDILWPLVHQLALLGFIFAVPFVSFAGWEPLRRFAATVVEVSVWPVIYNIGFGVAAQVSDPVFSSFGRIMQEPDYETAVGNLLAHLTTLAPLVGYFLFLIALGALTPAIAAMMVRSESGAAVAQAVAQRIGAVVGGLGGRSA